MEIYTCIST